MPVKSSVPKQSGDRWHELNGDEMRKHAAGKLLPG
jgi:hypothetical protein